MSDSVIPAWPRYGDLTDEAVYPIEPGSSLPTFELALVRACSFSGNSDGIIAIVTSVITTKKIVAGILPV